ncbi:16S rRNA (guanine(527)-N(7))-methyltransferase RsmG [bacterium]|nr:16S rRNA (guanine(527)-N(7))-methyltransferase RsmG [bacterium]
MSKLIENQLDTLQNGCALLGLPFTPDAKSKFMIYLSLLSDWNQRVNLFSRNDLELLASRHILESLALLTHINVTLNSSLCDIGSGAGFPGIPLKIIRPDLQLVLVEPIRKKSLFLEKVAKELRFSHFLLYQERAEDLPHMDFAPVKYAVLRAVGKMKYILKIGLPCLQPGGFMITFKGRDELLGLINQFNKGNFPGAMLHYTGPILPPSLSSRDTDIVIIRKTN